MAIGPQLPPSNPADIHDPNDTALAIAFYNAARAEILQRLNMRETTFLAWITVVGVILGFAAKGAAATDKLFDPRYLQLIPLLCLPFGLAIYRHSLILGYLGWYLRSELGDPLRQARNPKDRRTQGAPRHWDVSSAYSSRLQIFLVVEGIAYTFFLAVVPGFCLVYVNRVSPRPWCDPWFLGGLVCTVFAASVGLILVARDTVWACRLAKTK